MIENLPAHLRSALVESGALLTGHFILSSGRHSGFYLQCAKLCAHPELCERLAAELAEKIKAGLGNISCDVVLSPALGGVVIGYEVARQLKTPALFTERDKNSIMCLRRGFSLTKDERVLIVEDVVTTGGSVLEVARIVKDSGAQTGGYACLFDRSGGKFSPGPPVFSLARLDFPTYPADDCPLCAEGKSKAVKPGSRR